MKLCDLLQEQADSLRAGKSYAVVTIVEAEQLARTSGKMIVYADGSISGTVGGGMWEQAAINDAKKALASGENQVKTYDFNSELAKAGFQIAHTRVTVENPIKFIGEFTVAVKLHHDVTAQVKVNVVRA